MQRVYFLKTCEAGSITKAAEELFVSRQTLSSSLSQLERELGVTLFKRSKTGITLTAQGELLRNTILEQDRLWQDYLTKRLALEPSKKTVRFSTMGAAVSEENYAILYDFEKVRPDLTVHIANLDFQSALLALGNNEVDIVQGAYPTDGYGFERAELGLGDPYLIMGTESPLAQLEQVDFLTDMTGQTLFHEGPYIPAGFSEDCRRLGIATQQVFASRSVLTKMIGHCDGVLCMPHKICPRFESETTCSRPLVNLSIRIASALIYRKDANNDVHDLVDYFVSRMRGIPWQ